jgi:hypothetical protein
MGLIDNEATNGSAKEAVFDGLKPAVSQVTLARLIPMLFTATDKTKEPIPIPRLAISTLRNIVAGSNKHCCSRNATTQTVGTFELHAAVSYIKIWSVVQQYSYGKFI